MQITTVQTGLLPDRTTKERNTVQMDVMGL
jgi:hypothetical protein